MKSRGELLMKILALEFSSPQRSVAVLGADRREAQVIESGGGMVSPLGMIEGALGEAKLEREQIECLVIGLGPGSYTGIRSTVSLAQGWELARGVKLLGISSAECVAAQAQTEGLTGRVSVVIDAQREEFYLAAYELNATGCHEIEPLRILTLAQLRERTDKNLIGPEVTRWFPEGRIVFPRAVALGKLALGRTDFIPGEKLEPIYLRETSFVKAPPPKIRFSTP